MNNIIANDWTGLAVNLMEWKRLEVESYQKVYTYYGTPLMYSLCLDIYRIKLEAERTGVLRIAGGLPFFSVLAVTENFLYELAKSRKLEGDLDGQLRLIWQGEHNHFKVLSNPLHRINSLAELEQSLDITSFK